MTCFQESGICSFNTQCWTAVALAAVWSHGYPAVIPWCLCEISPKRGAVRFLSCRCPLEKVTALCLHDLPTVRSLSMSRRWSEHVWGQNTGRSPHLLLLVSAFAREWPYCMMVLPPVSGNFLETQLFWSHGISRVTCPPCGWGFVGLPLTSGSQHLPCTLGSRIPTLVFLDFQVPFARTLRLAAPRAA